MNRVHNRPGGRHEDAAAMSELRISVINAIGEVSAGEWDACANPLLDSRCVPSTMTAPIQSRTEPEAIAPPTAQKSDHESAYNPFISHSFLAALEESKSVGERTGWQTQHVLARTADGSLVAAAPCYAKSHSRGEYVFDGGWAEAYERAGGSYYPKLQVAVPFTPATGRRLLAAPGPHAGAAEAALAQGLIELCKLRKASSVHATFMS